MLSEHIHWNVRILLKIYGSMESFISVSLVRRHWRTLPNDLKPTPWPQTLLFTGRSTVPWTTAWPFLNLCCFFFQPHALFFFLSSSSPLPFPMTLLFFFLSYTPHLPDLAAPPTRRHRRSPVFSFILLMHHPPTLPRLYLYFICHPSLSLHLIILCTSTPRQLLLFYST